MGRLGCWAGKALEPQLSPTKQSCIEHPPPCRDALAKCPSVLLVVLLLLSIDRVTIHCWENLNTGFPVDKLKATLPVGVNCKPLLLPRSRHKPCYLQASNAERQAGIRTHTEHYIRGRVCERIGLNDNGKTSTFAEASGTRGMFFRWAVAQVTMSDVNEKFILNQSLEPG